LESVLLPFTETEFLLASVRMIFSNQKTTASNLTLFTIAQMVRLALKNGAINWEQLKERGLTRHDLQSLEKRLREIP